MPSKVYRKRDTYAVKRVQREALVNRHRHSAQERDERKLAKAANQPNTN